MKLNCEIVKKLKINPFLSKCQCASKGLLFILLVISVLFIFSFFACFFIPRDLSLALSPLSFSTAGFNWYSMAYAEVNIFTVWF